MKIETRSSPAKATGLLCSIAQQHEHIDLTAQFQKQAPDVHQSLTL